MLTNTEKKMLEEKSFPKKKTYFWEHPYKHGIFFAQNNIDAIGIAHDLVDGEPFILKVKQENGEIKTIVEWDN